MHPSLLIGLVCFSAINAKIYFKEEFSDDDWEKRWIKSKHKDDFGKWEISHGKFYGDAVKDKGLKTTQDAKFYSIGAKFDKGFSNKGKSLVIQFSVKHEQDIDCGGGYVKLMSSNVNLEDFHGETPYNIMFGPDICGPGTKKVHVIFHYKGRNHMIKKDIRCKDDVFTHLYTLIVNSDNTYEVQIDGEKAESGELEADWDFLPPKKIKDPDAKKPEDWDEREFIDDEDDKKPEDWDKPEHIPDPDAKKPEDWDDEMDGEWEPPMVDNPEYKGEWKPKQKKNPAYKGKWIHPEIENPDYAADDNLYVYEDMFETAKTSMSSQQCPNKIVLPPAIRVSPLLRFMRYSFLGLGIVWGFFRHRMICEKHAIVRQKEHEKKLADLERERILRKQEADKSLYDIYLNILETDLDEGGSLFGSVRE